MDLETLKEAAERTVFTEARIRSWIRKKAIRYVKIDGTFYLPVGAIDELVSRNTFEPSVKNNVEIRT
ncbi:hypothetical protein [Labrenzia sp. OB1]|uniref:hypothetical protein n=1 Tax=Labrenzia sp. OB1 TaxID=1561204 RepID=UPI0007B2E77D|nr:hypothetical protein [Labrenzia sp. OB1]KZM48962.1 hypothetical protein OA90_17330 [Labrenzia sp. OB1]